MSKSRSRKLKIGVIMDPWETILPESDTSLLILAQAQTRGHEAYYMVDHHLRWVGGQLLAQAEKVLVTLTPPYMQERQPVEIHLADLDVIFIRKNPPFDSAYLYLTQLLDLIKDKVFILNSPHGLRTANEKLFILNFPELIPPTLVSYEPNSVAAFYREHQAQARDGELVVKPLHLFAGKGLMKLQPQDFKSGVFEKILNELTQNGTVPVMVQPMLHVERGDKRVMVIHGQASGTLLRLPKAGEFRSNLGFGGTAVKTEITEHDRNICAKLAPRLNAEGLYLAGLDILDGYLTEINVTSPTGFPTIERLSGVNLQARLFDFVEQQVN